VLPARGQASPRNFLQQSPSLLSSVLASPAGSMLPSSRREYSGGYFGKREYDWYYVLYANTTSGGILKLMQYISLFGATLRTRWSETSSVRLKPRFSAALCRYHVSSHREWLSRDDYRDNVLLRFLKFQLTGEAMTVDPRKITSICLSEIGCRQYPTESVKERQS
jgi:hypothetical protein